MFNNQIEQHDGKNFNRGIATLSSSSDKEKKRQELFFGFEPNRFIDDSKYFKIYETFFYSLSIYLLVLI